MRTRDETERGRERISAIEAFWIFFVVCVAFALGVGAFSVSDTGKRAADNAAILNCVERPACLQAIARELLHNAPVDTERNGDEK